MASIGHIAVGLAAGRLQDRTRSVSASAPAMAWWSAASLLPDTDVIGFWLGVPYWSILGHRGFTHSIGFALAVSVVVGLVVRGRRGRATRLSSICTAVVLSHSVLDMMTDGGLGCAFWFPLDRTRYFLPWNPIPVAPIGVAFLSEAGLRVALVELVLFFPFWVVAFWPSRAR